MVPETPASAWYRGDPSIVSGGNTIAEDLCYDHATQLETSAEYLWDGNHDFTAYEVEVEGDADFICEGCGLDDAKDLEVEPCFAAELEPCCPEVEVEDYYVAQEFGVDLNAESYYSLCFDEEEACCSAAEMEDCDHGDAEDEVEDCDYSY